MSQATALTPFADGYEYIYNSPLGTPIPVPEGAKQIDKRTTGRTGAAGVDMSWPDLMATAEEWPTANIAIRLADDTLGYDIDAYDVVDEETGEITAKQGAETHAKMVAVLGELSPTWRSTRRPEDPISGIYFYKVAPGKHWVTGSVATQYGEHVDIIQRAYRYSVVYPSVANGMPYRWIDPTGRLLPLGEEPDFEAFPIPEMPESWQEALEDDPRKTYSVDVVAAPEEWPVAVETSSYVKTMIDGWHTDTPKFDYHKWLQHCCHRLVAAIRLGQVCEADVQRGKAVLAHRLATAVRASSEDPVREVWRSFKWSMTDVSHMTNKEAWESLNPKAEKEQLPVPEPLDGTEKPSEDAVGPETPAGLRSRILRRSGLRELPKAEAIIGETVLLRRTTCLLAGYNATFKSFIAMDMACCIATGVPWQRQAVTKGRVLYMIGEGAYGMEDRIAAWEEQHKTEVDDDSLIVVPYAINLRGGLAVDELVEFCAEEKFDLVVVDTVARSAPGTEENSNTEMGMFVAAVDRIRDALDGGSVLLVHHTGKDKSSIRGASALEFAMDTVHITSRDVGAPVVDMKQIKNKYGPDGQTVKMAIKVVGDGAVLVPVDEVALEGAQVEEKNLVASQMFTLLCETSGDEGLTKAKWVALAKEDMGIAQSTAYRAITFLVDSHRVEKTGRKGSERYVLRGTAL